MGRKEKKRKRVTLSGHDTHHVLFYRSEWNKGYALLLRRSFAYDIPVALHKELHATVRNVPVLEKDEAKSLWERYAQLDQKMELMDALEWLLENAPNEEFAAAISEQRVFLKENMEG